MRLAVPQEFGTARATCRSATFDGPWLSAMLPLAMRTTALIHLTGLMQPNGGTGGFRARGHRELVRESLRAVPGSAGATHRRWS